MSYREAWQAPLVSCMGGNVLAIDRQSGALLWQQRFARDPVRLLVAERQLYVATKPPPEGGPSEIEVLDLETGTRGTPITVSFSVRIAVAHEGRLYFAGAQGMLALDTKGRTLFRIAREVSTKSMWNGDTFVLVGYDAADQEMWRTYSPFGGSVDAALAIDGVLIQPDFEG